MLSSTFSPLSRSENTTVITLLVNLKVTKLPSCSLSQTFCVITQSVVPTGNYQYLLHGTTFPVMNFTGDYFVIDLPESAAGQEVVVNVTFQNGPCISLSSVTYKGKTVCRYRKLCLRCFSHFSSKQGNHQCDPRTNNRHQSHHHHHSTPH